MVFRRAKNLIFRYLLLTDFFPDQAKDGFLKMIGDEFLLTSIAYVEKEFDLALCSGGYFELDLGVYSDIFSVIWKDNKENMPPLVRLVRLSFHISTADHNP